jgi:hypothetical protein
VVLPLLHEPAHSTFAKIERLGVVSDCPCGAKELVMGVDRKKRDYPGLMPPSGNPIVWNPDVSVHRLASSGCQLAMSAREISPPVSRTILIASFIDILERPETISEM